MTTKPMAPGDKVVLRDFPGGMIRGKVDSTFPCPFCGGRVTVAEKGKILFHALPFCDSFGRMTVEEFVHECCVRFGLTEGGDA